MKNHSPAKVPRVMMLNQEDFVGPKIEEMLITTVELAIERFIRLIVSIEVRD
jgi:hypothetical protein